MKYNIDNNIKNKELTFGDIFNNFLTSTEINRDFITDYRPCGQPYFDYYIPNAIIVWLKNGDRLIYINKPSNF